MPDCPPFRLYVGNELPQLLPLLVGQMRSKGASVTGSQEAGGFSIPLPIGGSITGSFRVEDKSLVINIADRPDAVSCGTLESRMQDYLLDAKALLKSSKEA